MPCAGSSTAKGRPADHPLIVHLADAGELADWARDDPARRRGAREPRAGPAR